MKIEHFQCQDEYPQHQLQYWNMMASCTGNEGQPHNLQHCDTFKGNRELTFYPPDHSRRLEDLISYGNDGRISSTHADLNTELDEILNLNVEHLKRNRKAALDAFKDTLKNRGSLRKSTLEKWLSIWTGTSRKDDLPPYCMVIVFWLQKKINQEKR